MKILKIVLLLLTIGGLDLSGKSQRTKFYNFLYIFWMNWLVIFLFGIIKYFLEHLDDLSKLFQETMFVGAYIMIVTKAIMCMLYKGKYTLLLNILQNNYNLKENQPEIHFYIKAEKYSKIYFISFFTAIALGIITLNSRSLVIVLYNRIIGTLKPSHWSVPVPLSLFCNTQTSPGYEIVYILTVMSFISCAIFLSGVDSLLFGTGLHIVATFKELQILLTKIDDISSINHKINNELQTHNFANNFDNENKSFFQAMKEYIEFHNSILRCQQIFQEINGVNIFISMFGGLLLICSSLFRISKAEMGEFLFAVVVLTCGLLIVFNSTYIGELITTEGMNTADTAYHKLWYNRSPSIRKYYLFLIQIGQRPRFLHGLHFFNCSMETFSNVIKASFTVLAIMQNVE